jgi:hypothetical protein
MELTCDAAIWDNRSVFHSATFDYDGLGDRIGNRAVGIGEEPYLDPSSRSRTEVLTQKRELVDRTSNIGVEKTETISA